MRYDPELKEFYFNTEMILSHEGRQELHDTYDVWLGSLRDNPGQTFKMLATGMRPSKDDSKPGITTFQLVMSIVVIATFLSFIGCCITNRFAIAGWIGAGFLALLGFLMIFSKSSSSSESNFYNSTESAHGMPIFTRLQGLLFLIAAGAVVYVNLNLKYYTQSEIFVWIFVWAFAIVGLMMILNGISRLLAPKKVYTEEVNATCIGYLRTIDRDENHVTIKTSPVFEYYYQGEQFKSVYDIFANGPDGKIPVGSSTIIKIDPRSPEYVMGNSKGSGITFLVFGIVAVLVSFVPLMIILTGHANDGELQTSGIAVPQYERYISDEMVSEKFGDDWYIEKLTLASVTDEQISDTKYKHIVVGDSFKEVDFTADFEYSTGDEVYVIYRMTTIDGELTKEPLNFVGAEGTGYKGAHKAYR